jgi:dynein heavy chain
LVKASDDAKDIGNQKLDNFKALNIEQYKNELEEISETASKEFSNMNSMGRMKNDWEPLAFTCKAVPDKESYILEGEAIELI